MTSTACPLYHLRNETATRQSLDKEQKECYRIRSQTSNGVKMFIYIVHISVKPEFIEQFKSETLENARNTVEEPNNFRFDVLQQPDDFTKFVLYEAYADEHALDLHKQTAHYARWKSAVDPWMAEPRKAVKYSELFFTK
jgi:autoinducer 2-degrading protein